MRVGVGVVMVVCGGAVRVLTGVGIANIAYGAG